MAGIPFSFRKIFRRLGLLTLLPPLFVYNLYLRFLTGMHMRIFKKAVLRENEGRVEEAETKYRLFLKKNKDAIPAYFYLGNLYWRSGRKTEALKTFEEAKSACPT